MVNSSAANHQVVDLTGYIEGTMTIIVTQTDSIRSFATILLSLNYCTFTTLYEISKIATLKQIDHCYHQVGKEV